MIWSSSVNFMTQLLALRYDLAFAMPQFAEARKDRSD
jgi:hypothetical protein